MKSEPRTILDKFLRNNRYQLNSKFKNDDLAFIEKEFNNILLDDGYASLFDFRKFKEFIHTFSWYDLNDNFLGYWIMSDDSKKIEEIKFDREGKIFSVSRTCSEFNNNNIGELVWE